MPRAISRSRQHCLHRRPARMGRHRKSSVGMPKAKKAKVTVAGASDAAGDGPSQPHDQPAPAAARSEAASSSTAAPAAAPTAEAAAPAGPLAGKKFIKKRVVLYVEPGQQVLKCSVPAAKPEQAPQPAPPRDADHLRESALSLQREHAALCDNDWCDCAARGAAPLGEHDMFCQIYKCFAVEVGCCDGRDKELVDTNCVVCDCMCIHPPTALGQAYPNFVQREGRYFRQPWGDVDMRHFPTPRNPGRSVRRCSCGQEYGRYVPLCPWHSHGVTGKPRGEHRAEN